MPRDTPDDEWSLRYAYITGDRETLLAQWPQETERRGYLTLLDADQNTDPVGPTEQQWIGAKLTSEPDLLRLVTQGPNPRANPDRVIRGLVYRLTELGLTARQRDIVIEYCVQNWPRR